MLVFVAQLDTSGLCHDVVHCSQPSLLPNGYQGLIPRAVKRRSRVAYHLTPSSAKVKKSGAIPPLPQYGIVHK
jgi:hypothetical protein